MRFYSTPSDHFLLHQKAQCETEHTQHLRSVHCFTGAQITTTSCRVWVYVRCHYFFLITQLAHNKHNKPLKPRTLKGKALRDSNDLTTAFTFPKYLSWNPGLLLPCCIEDRPSQPTSKWTNWHLTSDIWLRTNWQNFNNKENWHLHKIGSTWHMNNNKLTKLAFTNHNLTTFFPTPISLANANFTGPSLFRWNLLWNHFWVFQFQHLHGWNGCAYTTPHEAQSFSCFMPFKRLMISTTLSPNGMGWKAELLPRIQNNFSKTMEH